MPDTKLMYPEPFPRLSHHKCYWAWLVLRPRQPPMHVKGLIARFSSIRIPCTAALFPTLILPTLIFLTTRICHSSPKLWARDPSLILRLNKSLGRVLVRFSHFLLAVLSIRCTDAKREEEVGETESRDMTIQPHAQAGNNTSPVSLLSTGQDVDSEIQPAISQAEGMTSTSCAPCCCILRCSCFAFN